MIRYDTRQQAFVVDFENASNDKTLSYRCGREALEPGRFKQTVPYALGGDHVLELDIFVDRSVIEMFVNAELCIVQRVYPMRPDSRQVRLFCEDGRDCDQKYRQMGDGRNQPLVDCGYEHHAETPAVSHAGLTASTLTLATST